jgi:hypothetical protein
MTVTAKQTPRQNADGDLCPPWCVTDHAKYGFHGSEFIRIDAPQYCLRLVRAVHPPAGRPYVGVDALAADVATGDAESLAVLIEGLADATPEQHRELAAAIRKAAAAITGAPDARASR